MYCACTKTRTKYIPVRIKYDIRIRARAMGIPTEIQPSEICRTEPKLYFRQTSARA